MQEIHILSISLLASALALGACSKSERDKGESAKVGAPGAAAKAVPEAPAAQPKPKPDEAKAADKPMRAPLTDTAPDALGKVPDGFGVAVGDEIPDVTVTDLKGEEVALSSLHSERPMLLIFYRGGWCPFCNSQVHAMTEAYGQFDARGVTPVMISVDQPEVASETQATYQIPFPVLSDPDLVAHEAFRVIHEASAEEREKLAGFGIDIEKYSGRDHHKFAIPSIFLVDKTGAVRWAHVDPAYKVRPSVKQLLGVLDEAGFKAP
jgi:peroxiredoxin